MKAYLENRFDLARLHSSVRTEALAGFTTFMAMSYIILVQPAVLSGAMFGMETGMDPGAVMVATCLAAAFASAVMGWYARIPVALAPGMGQNFFFVLTAIPAAAAAGHPEPWKAALGAVLGAGILFVILTVSGFRSTLLKAVSPALKNAMAAGIGLFIAFIGLRNGGIITTDPGTAVRLNPAFLTPDPMLFLFGLLFTATLLARGIKAAIPIGILVTLVLAFIFQWAIPYLPGAYGAQEAVAQSGLMQRLTLPSSLLGMPPSPAPTFLAADLAAAFTSAMIPVMLVFLFMDVFDTMGTLVAVTSQAGLQGREMDSPNLDHAMLTDATGTVVGAALGTSTVTSYIESATGVRQGGRTGLTALFTALCFLLALPLAPWVTALAGYSVLTAPALVLVGAAMMTHVRHIPWEDLPEALPAFLIILGIPLCYSIGDGIALGFLAHTLIRVLLGRTREIHPIMALTSALLLFYFVVLRTHT